MLGHSIVRSSVLSFLAHKNPSAASVRSFTRTSNLAATNYLLKYEYIPDVLEKRGPYREA